MSNAAVAPSLPREEETLDEYREQPLRPGRRKWRLRLLIPGALVLVAVGVWLLVRARGATGPVYRFATVERGDIEAAVSATGTLGAVTTVQVGTQNFVDPDSAGRIVRDLGAALDAQRVSDVRELIGALRPG